MVEVKKKGISVAGGFSCPLPILNYDTVQLAHGAGGRLMSELIDSIFIPCFSNDILERMEDQALLENPVGRQIVFTTDSFVVDPIRFPGGDIGDLAVNGTVNDLSMSGAVPRYLSAAFIIEEGFPIADLHAIALSMRRAADKAGVSIVTGDTKVVGRGHCDKVYINTAGIGYLDPGLHLSVSGIKAGDKIIVSGTLADHGMAVMVKREGLSFNSEIESDSAALNDLVRAMLAVSPNISALRDPTRGGLAATLNEFAAQSAVGIKVNHLSIPVRENVKAACEVLGIDPLTVANEGKLVAAVAASDADRILEAMQAHPLGRDAAIIGEVVRDHPGIVTLKTALGVERILDMPLGEQLPRIC